VKARRVAFQWRALEAGLRQIGCGDAATRSLRGNIRSALLQLTSSPAMPMVEDSLRGIPNLAQTRMNHPWQQTHFALESSAPAPIHGRSTFLAYACRTASILSALPTVVRGRAKRRERGAWRVEEEFVNAVRGREAVTHTDFVTATKYMEWTDAVTLSMRERREVQLPLF
jgi:hypothetical protein